MLFAKIYNAIFETIVYNIVIDFLFMTRTLYIFMLVWPTSKHSHEVANMDGGYMT